jgi:hypothetical protein
MSTTESDHMGIREIRRGSSGGYAILLNATNGGGNYGGSYYLTKTNTAQAIKLGPGN